MIIKEMPKDSRPRERFLKLGPEALSDAELFAILLRTGTRGKKGQKGENVIDMSNRLINEYGLDKLLECSLVELQKINGIGPAKAMQILTIVELQRRINQSKHPIKKITCAKDVFDIFHDRLKDEKQENFIVLMLNSKNNIIAEELITKGILDASIIHPREVFKSAIKNNAHSVVLIHNHPSGDQSPSDEDIKIAKILMNSGKILGIIVIDFIIIGKESYWSFRENKNIDHS